MLFGGNANNGANAGLVYANSNNAPSNANANIGSHLCLVCDGMTALPLGKKYLKLIRALVDIIEDSR